MGFTMRGRAWRYQIDALSERHRVAWFDHAGVGASGPIGPRFLKMKHLAQDALGVADELGWDSFHLAGLSMGGMISQHIALSEPERVRSLTLAATHAGGIRYVVPPTQGIRALMKTRKGSASRRMDALGELLLGREFREENPERAREVLRSDFTAPPSMQTQLKQIGAISRHRTLDRLEELGKLPVLIIRPGHDVLITPRSSDVLHDRIPGSRMVWVPGAGHAVSRERPELFNAALLEHFGAADRRDAEVGPSERGEDGFRATG